jgi:hypothetical protein
MFQNHILNSFEHFILLFAALKQFLITKQHKLSEEFCTYLTEIFHLADSGKKGGLSEDDLQGLVKVVRNEPIAANQVAWYFETFETNADVCYYHC